MMFLTSNFYLFATALLLPERFELSCWGIWKDIVLLLWCGHLVWVHLLLARQYSLQQNLRPRYKLLSISRLDWEVNSRSARTIQQAPDKFHLINFGVMLIQTLSLWSQHDSSRCWQNS